MGITKQMLAGPVTLPCTIKQIGEDGQAVEHKALFQLRRETRGEAEEMAKLAILGATPAHAIRLQRLAKLAQRIEGFDDFPAGEDSTLQERALAYFDGEEMVDVVKIVLVQFDEVTMPREFFRRV